MIFYFSGTGNSKYIASCLAERFGDSLIEITDKLNNSNDTYTLKDDERVGIVSPVYWYGLPKEVMRFAKQVVFKNYKNQYIYCFATYGGSAGRFAEQLQDILFSRGYDMNGKYGVKMADNYILGYAPDSPEKQIEINSEAIKVMKTYLCRIEARETANFIKRGAMAFVAPLIRPIYEKGDLTSKFYVTDKCLACGICSKGCPCGAIAPVEKTDDKPVWDNNKCSQCLRCIHSCPVEAIQYGKKTINRTRYLFDESKIKY